MNATLTRRLVAAIERNDRVATIRLAQRLYAAGDLRRTEIVGMFRTELTSVATLRQDAQR